MSEPTPDRSDEVFLTAIASRGRDLSVLTPAAEKLVDDWFDGRLSGDEAEKARRLVLDSRVAADRILERQLLAVAEEAPPIPDRLRAQILKAAAPPAPKPRPPRARFFSWQWSALIGAVAASLVAVTVGMLLLPYEAPILVAMADIKNPDVLFEPTDIRRRGGGVQVQTDAGARRFSEVDAPTQTLRELAQSSPSPQRERAAQSLLDLVGVKEKKARVFVDAALARSISSAPSQSVRIYDLSIALNAPIRAELGTEAATGPAFFVTRRP